MGLVKVGRQDARGGAPRFEVVPRNCLRVAAGTLSLDARLSSALPSTLFGLSLPTGSNWTASMMVDTKHLRLHPERVRCFRSYPVVPRSESLDKSITLSPQEWEGHKSFQEKPTFHHPLVGAEAI